MLYIKTKSRNIEWHVGEPLPSFYISDQTSVGDGRVITFQADGHELNWLLDAIRKAELGSLSRGSW